MRKEYVQCMTSVMTRIHLMDTLISMTVIDKL